MIFYSTNKKSSDVSFREAVTQGLATDGGLFMPHELPRLSNAVLEALPTLGFHDIAFEMAKPFLSGEMTDAELQTLIKNVFTFDVPLVQLTGGTHILELFHGPTMAFKDFGARFLAALTLRFLAGEQSTVLVATSGDTGGAVGHAFLGMKNIRVVILYPSGKVSHIQEQQLTTMGENVTAVEVDGTFDDCQRLAKAAFADDDLRKAISFTSANSINIARLLPQAFYYAHAAARLMKTGKRIIAVVPSGNFGNLTAGVFAKQMGIPISHFLAATNANDTVPRYLQSGHYEPKPSVETLSNAMDVGNPSNFVRLAELFGHNVQTMQSGITAIESTDDEAVRMMQEIFASSKYILDPHTAVGCSALKKYRTRHATDFTAVVIGTAHPAKFLETVKATLHLDVPIPVPLQAALAKPKQSVKLPNNFEALKALLLK